MYTFYKQSVKILTFSIFMCFILHIFTPLFYFYFMTHLQILRKNSGLGQEEIAKKLGISRSTYIKIEKGESPLTGERLRKLAELLNTTPENLKAGKPDSEGKFNLTYVPVTAQAGLLSEIESTVEFERYNIPMIHGQDLYMVKVEGDSMYPTFSHGDGVIIKRQDSPFLNWGDPFIVDTTEGMVIKRVFMNEDSKKYTLKSDNECYPEYSVNKKDIRALWHVKGVLSQNTCHKYISPPTKS